MNHPFRRVISIPHTLFRSRRPIKRMNRLVWLLPTTDRNLHHHRYLRILRGRFLCFVITPEALSEQTHPDLYQQLSKQTGWIIVVLTYKEMQNCVLFFANRILLVTMREVCRRVSRIAVQTKTKKKTDNEFYRISGNNTDHFLFIGI